MKTNELRIGNWVQIVQAGKNYQVEQHNFCTDDDGYSAFLDHITPIPLNEEWLLKCGFKKVKYDEDEYLYNFIYKNLILDVWGTKLTETQREYIFRHFDIVNHIKYVHQLQNLYFSLTGEELTIH